MNLAEKYFISVFKNNLTFYTFLVGTVNMIDATKKLLMKTKMIEVEDKLLSLVDV